jgi:diaminohydroxyphosphoribosylaminopyrimidine deaminase / 5-amino-6-(5-phosphoribosylamino)uracil reductase
MKTSEVLMSLALTEARKGGQAVRPNPQVGCAIELADGEIVVGYHQHYGKNHAERNAVDEARQRGLSLKNARLAVTLEPCSHASTHKKSPCVDLLLEEKWAEVIIGTEDPFHLVRGKGIEKLRAQGIPTTVGVLADECRKLNAKWLRAHALGRAHVTLKMATSLDGRWTSNSGQSQWITSKASRLHAHELRGTFDAVITGGSTVRKDDPQLTARFEDDTLRSYQPKVFVLTRNRDWTLAGTRLEKHPRGAEMRVEPDLALFLRELLEAGLYDTLLEAGPELSSRFLEAGLVDEIHWYVESQILGGKQARGFEAPFLEGRLPGLNFVFSGQRALGPTTLLVELRHPRHET